MSTAKPQLIVVTCLSVLLITIGTYRVLNRPEKHEVTPVITESQVTEKAPLIEEAPKKPESIRLIAAGDFIAHDALNLRAKRADGTYDYLQFMSAMKPFFAGADIRFCNQAVPSGGPQFGISGYPVFNTPLEMVQDMHALGCNLVNTGTNHSLDKGTAVITEMLNAWDKQASMLGVIGTNRSDVEQRTVRYFEKNGVRFAAVSFVTYTNASVTTPYAVNMYNDEFARRLITEARSRADIVIVSMRWGTEYSPGVNSLQERYAQSLADMGADIIIGHGPHVLEPVRQLTGKDGRKTTVWYSIGNFLNAQIPAEALTGCLAVMDISVQSRQVMSIGCLPTYMHYEWTAEQKAIDKLEARTNFHLVPLDTANDLLARSQLNTTVDAQNERIRSILNKYTDVKILKPTEF